MPPRVLGGTARSWRVFKWSRCWQSYPTAFALDVLARRGAGGAAQQAAQFPLSPDLVPQDTAAALLTVEGDPFNRTA